MEKMISFKNGNRQQLIAQAEIAFSYPSIIDDSIFITLVTGEHFRAKDIKEIIFDRNGLEKEAEFLALM